MKIVYIIIYFFILPLNGFSQAKITGEMSFLSLHNDKVTDSFQLIVAKDYIQKKYTFSLNVLKFDDMVFIKDSGKIYYINNDLRIVLWRNVKGESWDTMKFTETSTKKDIESHSCTLFTREDKQYSSVSGQTSSHKWLWLTNDILIDYDDKYYGTLQGLGIYEHGLMMESNTLFESEKDTTKSEYKLLSISGSMVNKMIKLPDGYTYKEYNRENILDLIREQTEKVYIP